MIKSCFWKMHSERILPLRERDLALGHELGPNGERITIIDFLTFGRFPASLSEHCEDPAQWGRGCRDLQLTKSGLQ